MQVISLLTLFTYSPLRLNCLFCRSIYATYEKDVATLGIAGKRYTIPEIVFANDTVNEDNRCFQPCLRDPNRECVGSGVLDLRSCLFGNQLTNYNINTSI